jgi:streptogramin lyase
MISLPLPISQSGSALISTCDSSRSRMWNKLAALSAVAAVLLFGTVHPASAQTAVFSGATPPVWVQSTLNLPSSPAPGIAVDGSGDIFLAGPGSVLEFTPTGNGYASSTVGSGFGDIFAIAVDGSGNVYVADVGNAQVVKETLSGGSFIQSTVVSSTAENSFSPWALAVDAAGDVFIGDQINGRVLKETLSGGIYAQSTVINFIPGRVSSMAVDASGNLYITTANTSTAMKIAFAGGSYSQSYSAVGTGGPGVPTAVAVDASGNVYISGSQQTLVAGNLVASGFAFAETLVNGAYVQSAINVGSVLPTGIAVTSAGNLLIAGGGGGSGLLEETAVYGNFGPTNVGTMNPQPISLTFTFETPGVLGSISVLTQGATGQDFVNAYNAYTGSCAAGTAYNAGQSCTVNVTIMPLLPGARYGAVVLYSSTGSAIATGFVQGTGVGPQLNFLPGVQSAIPAFGLSYTGQVAVDGSGNIYITDFVNNRVLLETLSAGAFTQSIVASGLDSPLGVAVDGGGNVYIADTYNNRVLVESPLAGGYTQTTIGNGLNLPMRVAVDGSGNVYVSDYGNERVVKETLEAGVYAQSVVVSSGLNGPSGVAVDASGNVYIADVFNNRVIEEKPSLGGYAQSTLNTSQLHNPNGVAVDANGNIYISDSGNDRVLRESPSSMGYIESTIGSGLNGPTDAAVDGAGNVYISDTSNSRVLKEDLADQPSLRFASTAVGSTSSDSPQTLTIENIGNAALDFVIPSTGTNPGLNSPNFTFSEKDNPACPLVSAGASSAGTLAAGATCQLPISFAPTAAGALSGSLVLTDNNLNAAAPVYASQDITLSGTATQATPTITWARPAAIPYGTPLSAIQLNATSTVAGTFAYSPSAGAVLGAGAQTLTVTFTPTDTAEYTTATATVLLTVNQAAPAITWAAPAAIPYGVPLGVAQLNATATIAGVFSYSPAAGTLLTAGTQTLTVTFTPTDATDYTSASATATLAVNQATPTITWATPAAITYGTPLSAAQLNATATVAGVFSYSPAAGTLLTAGTQTLTATFTPTDATDYTTASATVSITVNPSTPAITWATPAAIAYRTLLSSAQLNATSPVSGYFSYSPAAGTILGAGQQTLTVTFTPTDTVDYATATASVMLTVSKATPAISWPTPSPIAYGTPLGDSQLNTDVTVAGTFTYSPAAGTVLTVGAQTLTATFTPTDTTDYTTATATVTITVNQAAPTISWVAPAAIVYGTPLSAAQLNATSTVAGAITYSPAAGTVLAAGVQSITATFTPSDTTDYATTTASVPIMVNQATPTITWAAPAAISYGTLLSGTQLDASSTVAGTFTYSPAAGTLLTAGAQQLTVLFTPADAVDYAAVSAGVTLVVDAEPIAAPLPQSFGAVNIGTASPAIRLTFTIEVGVTVGSTAVLTEGASGLDFANAGTGSCTANSAFAAGQTCTVNVTFTPKFAGTRYGAVTLYDGNGNVLAASYLQGTGIGPQINYLPGTVSTAASATGGLLSPYALTTDASGNIYIADDAANVIWKETPSGAGYSQSVVPTSSLNSPTGVAVDGSGNIYIADTSNSRVLKESPSPGGYTESVVADSANNGILSPISVAVDGAGNVYFFSSGTLYEETLSAGSYVQNTVPYTGVSNPSGVAVDGNGNIYISDSGNNQVVLEMPSAGSYIQSVLPSTGLNYPLGVSVDGNNNVYIADYGNQRVVKETFTGGSYLQSTIFSSPQSYPFSVAVDGGGNVFIADPDNNQVLKEDFVDAPDLAFANTTEGSTSSDSPQTVMIENAGNAPLTFPVPSAGNNPSISANFTLSSAGAGVCPLVKAGASSAGTLAAGATCQLPISFTPEAPGSLSGALVLTDNNLNAAAPGYATQRIALSGTGVLPAATITWATPAAITYGTPLSKKQLNASVPVAGKFTYSPAAGAVLTAGSELLTVTFTPSDTAKYAPATATVTLTVNQAIPAIKWATPAAIAYGTALGSAQLDASSTVSGTFSYSPAAGTVLTAGEQLLTASFTPTDTVDYATSTASVTLQVNKAAPVVSWATPAPITYGTALSAAQLNASSAVAGTFSYAPAMGKVLAAGAQALTVTFTPADTTDYTTVTVSTTLTVHKATPNMTLASSASSVASGKSITFTATLTGSGAAPTGTVAFLNGTKQLGAGTLKSNGAATYATSGLAVGKHIITASYGGDGNYVSVVSAAITVTVTAP